MKRYSLDYDWKSIIFIFGLNEAEELRHKYVDRMVALNERSMMG